MEIDFNLSSLTRLIEFADTSEIACSAQEKLDKLNKSLDEETKLRKAEEERTETLEAQVKKLEEQLEEEFQSRKHNRTLCKSNNSVGDN
mmetsp:Transcript_22704/g.28986  ORF Transcript_22704/g.28986 Transcript_22704/m.28986 type:complete len:89 (+) Transcript_22704:1-267(+)